jgi:hypothetical protein
MPFCQISFMKNYNFSTWHFANLPFCQLDILPTWHFANMTFYSLVKLSFWQHDILKTCLKLAWIIINLHPCQNAYLSNSCYVSLPPFQLDILSTCVLFLLYAQLVIFPTWHFINLAFYQLGILSTWHFINLAFYQLGIFINLAFYQLAFWSITCFDNLLFYQRDIVSTC